jgi:hypothetical protein
LHIHVLKRRRGRANSITALFANYFELNSPSFTPLLFEHPILKGGRNGMGSNHRFIGVLLWAACSSNFGAAATESIQVWKTADGASINVESLPQALSNGSVLMHLPAGSQLSVFGSSLSASESSRLMVSLSSELMTFAALSGSVSLDERHSLTPGRAGVVALVRGEVHVSEFDAARLAASAAPGVAVELRDVLKPVIATQQKRRRWGYYTSSSINTQLSSLSGDEALRRQYLSDPTIIQLRRDGGGDPVRQRELAAQRFVSALSARDGAGVAALIDPSPFMNRGPGWREERRAYAERLVSSGHFADLAGSSVAGGAEGRFDVSAGTRKFLMTTVERDGVPFVAAMEIKP